MTTLPAPETVTKYLARLGLSGDLAPTVETLVELQRRHLDAVPYENLAIMLRRPDPTDPAKTLERDLDGFTGEIDPLVNPRSNSNPADEGVEINGLVMIP